MESVSRMALVDPRLLDHISNQQTKQPIAKTLNALDDEMRRILDKPITTYEKVKQYNQVLMRYNDYEDKKNEPIQLKVLPTDSTNRDIDGSRWEREVIDSVPKSFKRRAQILMNRIKAAGGPLSWNTQGELINRGNVLTGSNIVDLVNDVLRKRKSRSAPAGWQQFSTGLRDSNIPQEAIGHPDRWAYISRGVDTDTGVSTPVQTPGTTHLGRRRQPRRRTGNIPHPTRKRTTANAWLPF